MVSALQCRQCVWGAWYHGSVCEWVAGQPISTFEPRLCLVAKTLPYFHLFDFIIIPIIPILIINSFSLSFSGCYQKKVGLLNGFDTWHYIHNSPLKQSQVKSESSLCKQFFVSLYFPPTCVGRWSDHMYTHQHVLDDEWVFNDDHHIYICRGIVPHEEREWMPGEKGEFMGTDCNCTLHWQLHCDAQHTALETALYTALHCAKHCTAMHWLLHRSNYCTATYSTLHIVHDCTLTLFKTKFNELKNIAHWTQYRFQTVMVLWKAS